MEHKDYLPYSQEGATGLYREPGECSPQPICVRLILVLSSPMSRSY
jgi:hypothetical protein